MKEIINSINNKIIRTLGGKTWLWGDTLYVLLWRYSKNEILTYLNQIEKAKAESGCYTWEGYQKWYNENCFEKDYENLKKTIDK